MISVIIPSYNEEEIIKDCLDSLMHQKTDKKFEVILVDNNSTDETIKIAKKFMNRLDLKIVTEKQKGRGAARHLGFEMAKGDILFSTDADTTVPTDWIEKLYINLKSSNAIAITGTNRIQDCIYFTNSIFNHIQPLSMKLYRLFTGYYWLSGFNFAIYKDAYVKSGGFNPNLKAQEDVELSYRVNKVGEIKYIPDCPVISSGRRFRTGIIKGFIPYITTFISYFFFKKENIDLSDVR